MRFGICVIAVLAIAVIYMSCNKHTIQKPTSSCSKGLNGWSDSKDPSQRTQLSFDGQHHVVKEETPHDITSYEFNHDSVFIKEFNKEEDRYVSEFKGKLDNNRRLLSGVATSSYIPTSPDTVFHTFMYNNAGFLLTEKRVSSSSDTFLLQYEYANNLVKSVKTFTNGVLYNSKEFVYYNDNDFSYSLPEETKFKRNINNLVGLAGNKLIKTVVSTGRNGKQKYKLNYEYQMDANGYASKMISKKGRKVSGVVTYYYDNTYQATGNPVAARNASGSHM